MKTQYPSVSIKSLIAKMDKEQLNSIEVVDFADNALRAFANSDNQDVRRSVSLGALKSVLSQSIDEIIRLQKRLEEYEQIKQESEFDAQGEDFPVK